MLMFFPGQAGILHCIPKGSNHRVYRSPNHILTKEDDGDASDDGNSVHGEWILYANGISGNGE